jgi:hypothetical protein
MTFANSSNENLRLLLLAGIAAVLEFLLVPRLVSGLLLQSAQWPIWAHLLVISVPRLLLMAVLVAALGPFRWRAVVGVFIVLYAVLVLVRFNQGEVYVNWEDAVAGSRATLPYLAGLVGIAMGFLVRRGRAATA